MKIFLNTTTIKAGKRNDLSNPITLAFHNLATGIRQAGHTPILSEHCDVYDVGIVFGSITRRKLDTDRAISITKMRESGKPILSLDSSFFSTHIRQHLNSSETFMFRIGVGDCVGSEPFRTDTYTSVRFDWFKQTFNFSEKTFENYLNRPIMFVLQTERGWQYDELIPYKDWAKDTLDRIRQITDRTVVLRAHPNQAREPITHIAGNHKNILFQIGERARQSMIRDLQDVSVVVTHSSSVANEALVEGIPTIALDKRCIAYDQCWNDLSKINNPELFEWDGMHHAFNSWANQSYHVNEMKESYVINYYLDRLGLL